jgi:hypothetical protein
VSFDGIGAVFHGEELSKADCEFNLSTALVGCVGLF